MSDGLRGVAIAPWTQWRNSWVSCPAVIGNVVVYSGVHHITNAYAVSAVPLLRPFVEPFFG